MHLTKMQDAYMQAVAYAREQCLSVEHIVPVVEMRRAKWYERKRPTHVGYYIIDETLTTSLTTILFR